jgi:hypothetical protein
MTAAREAAAAEAAAVAVVPPPPLVQPDLVQVGDQVPPPHNENRPPLLLVKRQSANLRMAIENGSATSRAEILAAAAKLSSVPKGMGSAVRAPNPMGRGMGFKDGGPDPPPIDSLVVVFMPPCSPRGDKPDEAVSKGAPVKYSNPKSYYKHFKGTWSISSTDERRVYDIFHTAERSGPSRAPPAPPVPSIVHSVSHSRGSRGGARSLTRVPLRPPLVRLWVHQTGKSQ